ncbi:hypothetical protein [Helicobacter sp. 13S00477-4]|uniref:hypothetical protein n=1 Tax=Helicobacter sp. 13S00477-4 TaxID=1905759 RepID=UPI000BA64155|nr:hypothetical protein [Helicobacter sp. 13S00477-4]PAF51998.1 hypothetical protein BKH44_04880 [Helicobacter sp. 13S00477-4]
MEVAKAIEISQSISDIGMIGLLFLGIVFLAIQLKDKKRLEEALVNLVDKMTIIIEINKKYQSYYEKMISDYGKYNQKCHEMFEIQNDILRILKEKDTKL